MVGKGRVFAGRNNRINGKGVGMVDFRERFCRYKQSGHYVQDVGFIPVRGKDGRINGHMCPECQERRKKEPKKAKA